MALTVKQEKFAQCYAKTGNATQAYIEAGYKATHVTVARTEGSRILAKPCVKARIEELQKKAENETILTLEQIKERLSQIATQVLDEEQIVVEGSGNGYSSARIMKKKASIRDATKALELLAKMKGAFDSDHSNDGTVTIVFKNEENIKD